MSLSYYELDYEADRKKHEVFIAGGDHGITVNTPPVATYEGYIAIVRGGEVVGELDASFDFSKLDPRFHELALCLLANGGGKSVSIPSDWYLD